MENLTPYSDNKFYIKIFGKKIEIKFISKLRKNKKVHDYPRTVMSYSQSQNIKVNSCKIDDNIKSITININNLGAKRIIKNEEE